MGKSRRVAPRRYFVLQVPQRVVVPPLATAIRHKFANCVVILPYSGESQELLTAIVPVIKHQGARLITA